MEVQYTAPVLRNAACIYMQGKGLCPAGYLLGIDATPEPGLVANFFGRAKAALLAEVDATLSSIEADQRYGGFRPVHIDTFAACG